MARRYVPPVAPPQRVVADGLGFARSGIVVRVWVARIGEGDEPREWVVRVDEARVNVSRLIRNRNGVLLELVTGDVLTLPANPKQKPQRFNGRPFS